MSFMKPGIDTKHVIEQARNAKSLATLATESPYYEHPISREDVRAELESIRSDKEKCPITLATKDDLIAFKNKCAGKSQDELLEYLGINVTYNENGSKSLSNYGWPYKSFSFAAAGIDETKLLDGVTEIKGDCNLTGSSLKNLGDVRKIGGDLILPLFTNAKDLSNIRSIGGDIICDVENAQDAVDVIKKVKLDNCKMGGYIKTGDFTTSYSYPITSWYTPQKSIEESIQVLRTLQAKNNQ